MYNLYFYTFLFYVSFNNTSFFATIKFLKIKLKYKCIKQVALKIEY